MTHATDLETTYRAYIDCLNAQRWDELHRYVHAQVSHNARHLGVAGYRAMLEQDYRDIPDLQFHIALLVADAGPLQGHVAARLQFDCTPAGEFLGLAVNGQRVQFTENVFYTLRDGKIAEVWSVIDRAAIESQLGPPTGDAARDSSGKTAP
jgi:predicted ester cyclase